jgi:hypothetical protein
VRSTSYVCFDCRRAVKAPAFASRNWRRPNDHPPTALGPRCPGCAKAMIDLGHKFKAPKKNDAKQWDKVRLLHDAGFSFFRHRRMPQTLAEVDAFLADQKPKPPFGTKRQSKRTRRAKLAKVLSGPTYGPAKAIETPGPFPTPADQRRRFKAALKRSRPASAFRKPARKRK